MSALSNLSKVRKARNVSELSIAISNIQTTLSTEFAVLSPFLKKRSVISISAVTRRRGNEADPVKPKPRGTRPVVVQPVVQEEPVKPKPRGTRPVVVQPVVQEEPVKPKPRGTRPVVVQEEPLQQPSDEDSNALTINHTGDGKKIPKAQGLTPHFLLSFKPPLIKEVAAHNDVLHSYHEQMAALDTAETSLQHHFAGLKGQAIALNNLIRVKKEAKSVINKGLDSLNEIAGNSMPVEFKELGNEVLKHLDKLIPSESYKEMKTRTYVGHKDGVWIYTTYLTVTGLTTEDGSTFDDYNIVLTAKIESVVPKGTPGRPVSKRAMTLSELVNAIGDEAKKGQLTLDMKGVDGKPVTLPYRGITTHDVAIVSLPAEYRQKVKYVLGNDSFNYGRAIGGWFTITEKEDVIPPTPEVKEPKSKLKTITYYITDLMDFRLPGKFPVGRRVQSFDEFKKVMEIKLRYAHISTIMDRRELGFDTAKAKKHLGSIPNVKSVEVEDGTTLVVKLAKKSSEAELENSIKAIFGLFQILTGNTKNKSVTTYKRIPEPPAPTMQLNFNLLNSLKGQKADIATPSQLSQLQESLHLDDEAMEAIKDVLLKLHN